MPRPFTLLIKPTGPDCNIACKYCFYACKTSIFGGGRHRMSDEVLDKMVSSYMSLRFPSSSFAFQGGEPTLMGLEFYQKVVELQKKYGAPGQMVSNALQTNGILLDDDWCEFLAEYKFLVGISLDGPKQYHDHYRVDHKGDGTFDRVMAGIKKCEEHNVEYNILVLLNNVNVQHPDELFDFLTRLGIKYLQFVPCVEQDDDGNITDYSITADEYGDFLCKVFDRWTDLGPEKLSIRMFDSVLQYCLSGEHSVCTLRPNCNDYIVIEHNGDAFACDFFVDSPWNLGNIMDTPIEKLAGGKEKRAFSRLKADVTSKCLVCRHFDACRGGCLKDRITTDQNYKTESYFCDAYKKFYDHALAKMRLIALELHQRNMNKR